MKDKNIIFNILLWNSLVASVTNFFIWFALVFWAFLQTNSLIVSSLIWWLFAIANMLTALQFWHIVDHNKKHDVITWSSIGSLVSYTLWALIYFSQDSSVFSNSTSRQLWLLVIVLMSWTIIWNLRNIALSTTVSLLLPSEEHAKANGKIWTINGIWFTLTSVASWLVIWLLWMWWAIASATIIMFLVIIHLFVFRIPEEKIVSIHSDAQNNKKLNIKQTLATIKEIPWLFALIFFTTFNNFLWGVFMSLMDPYWLLLVSVETRWMIFWFVSLAFIAAGLLISKKWLWKNPLKTIFIVNIIMWITSMYFVIQPSIWLLISWMIIRMFCSPFAEASESTVLQKVVPYEKQWRVFWIAQSIESAAMPITALFIGPITEIFFIPLMSEWWRWANLIGWRFWTGQSRGIAIVFILAWFLWLITTLLAYKSKYYTLLSKSYLKKENNNKKEEIILPSPADIGIN